LNASILDKALIWVEPMTRWLEAARHAGEISKSENYHEIKSFVEKIGSNLLLQDKKIKIKWKEPFLILRKYNGFGEEIKEENKKDTDLKKGGCPNLYPGRESNPHCRNGNRILSPDSKTT